MSDPKFQFDGRINISTLIYAIVLLIAIVTSYVQIENKITRVEDDQNIIKSEYVSEEQLQYIVVERIDRLESKLERRLLELEQKLESQLNRIEEKIDQ